MNTAEFKAWFEGFTEAMDRAPNAKQWKRIKERVDEIDGTATTERVFIDRYWRRYWEPYYAATPYFCTNLRETFSPGTTMNITGSNVAYETSSAPSLSSSAAFQAIGKAEMEQGSWQ
jgi:hypothetical protein